MGSRYRVEITAPAASDLEEIVDYHIGALSAPQAAKSLLDDFDALVGELEQTSGIYLKVRDRGLSSQGYRWAPLAKSYAAFFVVDESSGVVTIDRILYHPQKWQGILRL